MNTGVVVSWILISYAVGCITGGYYWVRFRTSRDLRKEGSGSLGARNSARITGPAGFVVVLLWDAGKGALVMGVAKLLEMNANMMALCVLAVVIGHIRPAQLGFKGGKGIATSLGAFLVFEPILVGLLFLSFLPFYAITRSLTLGGLLAYLVLPFVLWIIGQPPVNIVTSISGAGLILYAHRANIVKKFQPDVNESRQSEGG